MSRIDGSSAGLRRDRRVPPAVLGLLPDLRDRLLPGLRLHGRRPCRRARGWCARSRRAGTTRRRAGRRAASTSARSSSRRRSRGCRCSRAATSASSRSAPCRSSAPAPASSSRACRESLDGAGRRARRASAPACSRCAVAIGGASSTNRWYATHRRDPRVRPRRVRVELPAARDASSSASRSSPGRVFNDMTAGGYLTWDDPTGKGVYVDGRLEVYDTPFFGAYLRQPRRPRRLEAGRRRARHPERDGLPPLGKPPRLHPDAGSRPEWRLVYYDETVGDLRARRAGARRTSIAPRAPPSPTTWRPKNEPRSPAAVQTFRGSGASTATRASSPTRACSKPLGETRGRANRGSKRHRDRPSPRLRRRHAPARGAVPRRVGQASRRRACTSRRHCSVDPANETTRAMLAKLDAIAN